MDFPEPTTPVADWCEVLLTYLDYYRSRVTAKLDGLSDEQVRGSVLPSGWFPLELLKHLVHVERRWLVWGFEGEDVGDPWADHVGERWHVTSEETLDALLEELRAGGARTRAIVAAHDLGDVGQPGERWDGHPPATLERVLLHVMQEYARHLGHLDVVREIVDGVTGE